MLKLQKNRHGYLCVLRHDDLKVIKCLSLVLEDVPLNIFTITSPVSPYL